FLTLWHGIERGDVIRIEEMAVAVLVIEANVSQARTDDAIVTARSLIFFTSHRGDDKPTKRLRFEQFAESQTDSNLAVFLAINVSLASLTHYEPVRDKQCDT